MVKNSFASHSIVLLLFLLYSQSSLGAEIEAKGECLPMDNNNNEFQCASAIDMIACEDNNDNCATWAQRGECKKNAVYMVYNCRKSCETCVSLHHGVTQNCPSQGMLQDTLRLLIDTQQYIYDKSSVKSSMYLSCVNHDPNCATFALRGECDRNPSWMSVNCPAVCKVCN